MRIFLIVFMGLAQPCGARDWVTEARTLMQAGQVRAAAAAWEAAAEADPPSAGRWLRAGAYAAWRARAFSEALRLLDRAAPLATDDTARASVLYYRGLVLTDLGALRSAHEALTRAAALALQGSPALVEGIAEATAALADQEGRFEAAIDALLAAHPPPELAFHHTHSIGWVLLSRASQDAGRLPEARAWLELALEQALAEDYRLGIAAAAANLAWAALLGGDLPEAEARIAQVRDLQVEYDALFLDLVDGDRLLALGDAALAGHRFADAERRARAGTPGDSEGGWRARFGHCRVWRAQGELDRARSECRAALAELERVGSGTTLRSGRVPFFAARRALLEETLDLTIAAGDLDGAFAVADSARARVLRALQARSRLDALDAPRAAGFGARLATFHEAREALEAHLARAELAADGARWRDTLASLEARHEAALAAAFEYLDDVGPLTAPAGADGAAIREWIQADEALLALARHRGGWQAFLVADGRIEQAAVTADDPLGPFAARFAGRAHRYVVPGGHPRATALHAGGSTSYVPYAGLLLRPPPRGQGTLVIADARLDLPAAGTHARTLAASRSAHLLDGRAATRAAVLPALSGPGLIHFAGHGVLHADDPWSAWLALAGDDRLALPDLLTRPIDAQLVVLSGCETGPDAALLSEDGVGLPAAFLAAGAATVIASDRPLPDGATARFFTLFYEELATHGPAAALVAATRRHGEATGLRVWGRR